MNNIRIGFGYDVHEFAEGRKLFLGGVEIPSAKGLLGHSDADVLLHAICDALLGAVALGDIGKHFPNTDAAFKDADSRKLLQESYRLVTEKGFALVNLDSTVIMEEPKLSPYIDEMRAAIASVLNTDADRISIKATTSEKLGFVGRKEGAAAYATVLIMQKES